MMDNCPPSIFITVSALHFGQNSGSFFHHCIWHNLNTSFIAADWTTNPFSILRYLFGFHPHSSRNRQSLTNSIDLLESDLVKFASKHPPKQSHRHNALIHSARFFRVRCSFLYFNWCSNAAQKSIAIVRNCISALIFRPTKEGKDRTKCRL